MTTTTYDKDAAFANELNSVEKEALSEAAGPLDNFGSAIHPPSALRYGFYRRRGYGKAESLRYALAFLRNVNEQYERRLGHDTGAEGWRKF